MIKNITYIIVSALTITTFASCQQQQQQQVQPTPPVVQPAKK